MTEEQQKSNGKKSERRQKTLERRITLGEVLIVKIEKFCRENGVKIHDFYTGAVYNQCYRVGIIKRGDIED